MILSRFERTIAKRYLLPGKGEGFIFIVAGISLFAVTLGVWALITVMSVMNGFRAELFDKVVGLNGHAVVQGYGGRLPDWQAIVAQAQATPGVTSATPLIEQPLMASYDGRVEGVIARGMRVTDIRNNPTIQGNVVAGNMNALVPGADSVAIGSRLAEALGAQVGGQISLISPQGQTTPFGTVPRIVSYTVAAIFEVGVYDYDKAFVLMPIEDAQTLLMLGDAVGMVEIDTADPDRVGAIVAPLAVNVGQQGVVTDWRQMNASLFEALAVERVAMFVILAFIVLVAAFNILSSLIMLVRAKTRDIAIMRTMGATSRSILKIFIAIGLSISVAGILVGILFAVVTAIFRQQVVNFVQLVTGQNLWDPSIRFLTELPYKANPFEIFAIIALTLVLSFLATLIPAWRAAKTDPVQVLRYE
ncbi:lipoprotein-releasing system permease protein [Sphingomonas laterariae]|uniref:Lipoprotein-releasing system permease protein n=1 Tax=Edaphosphingomonas laterariae TaxID=861865 RepID=A0A239H821_9SPHN|nr:lipoprotein-releasing ABC transporter permease subunit [Sphingomonas laterariae]SNS76404.1 lipoprotein-releasing system permease protein [Sphingomonas laterariae]